MELPHFNNAQFTFMISSRNNPLFAKQIYLSDHGLYINLSDQTDCSFAEERTNYLYIIGLCIDSHAELDREEIPSFLISQCKGELTTALSLVSRFAGSFVILFSIGGQLFIANDASGSIPVYYSDAKTICVSSSDQMVSTECNYKISQYAVQIRQSQDLLQPLPNDITLYENVRILLPNHYLKLLSSDIKRYAPLHFYDKSSKKNSDQNKILEKQINQIDNIIKEYARYNHLICPLTGGRDSRLVFAFLKRHLHNLECFTFFHKGFTQSSGDIYIPQVICDTYKIKHHLVDDLIATDSYFQSITEIIGTYHSRYTINLAYTYTSTFNGVALVNSSILDQVGKSLLGNSLPLFFARSSYFTAKQHNFSSACKRETSNYIDSVKAEELFPAIYDLFAIENRLGRWASQGNMIYSAAGIVNLNIFNCREIIESWMQIPRRKRKKYFIHNYFFNAIAPDLLQFPFNPDDKTSWIKDYAPLFLIGTYAKYLAAKLRFRIKKV
jgi:hypothetical protein